MTAGVYISALLAEAALVYWVYRAGRKHPHLRTSTLIGGSWKNAAHVTRDLALGIALLAGWKVLSSGLERGMGGAPATVVGSWLPRSPLEIALWVPLSLSAGFAEELAFRGYLQSRFMSLTKSRWTAVGIQAVLFGLCHLYQGAAACARITLFGVGFGAMALWRRSLRPGMIAHAGTDIVAGIFRI